MAETRLDIAREHSILNRLCTTASEVITQHTDKLAKGRDKGVEHLNNIRFQIPEDEEGHYLIERAFLRSESNRQGIVLGLAGIAAIYHPALSTVIGGPSSSIYSLFAWVDREEKQHRPASYLVLNALEKMPHAKPKTPEQIEANKNFLLKHAEKLITAAKKHEIIAEVSQSAEESSEEVKRILRKNTKPRQ